MDHLGSLISPNAVLRHGCQYHGAAVWGATVEVTDSKGSATTVESAGNSRCVWFRLAGINHVRAERRKGHGGRYRLRPKEVSVLAEPRTALGSWTRPKAFLGHSYILIKAVGSGV